MRKVKYFTKGTLIEANAEAVRTKRNSSLYGERLKRDLPEKGRYPVGMALLHNDHEMRVQITVGPDEDSLQSVWLDIPFDTYNALPEAEVPE